MLKKRGIRALIITLLIALSTSCFSLMFVNLVSAFTPTQNEQPPVKAADLVINTLDDLKNFSSNHSSYSGKIVELGANIDCGGADIKIGNFYQRYDGQDIYGNLVYLTDVWSFSGTFNGKGYTISNLNISSSKNEYVSSTPGYSPLGLFLANSGTIKNLKVANINITVPSGGAEVRVGGITGYNTGTIENCIVNNIKFVSGKNYGNCYAGAIAGINSGTINNCLVNGDYTIAPIKGANNGLCAFYFAGQGNYPTNSAFMANMKRDYTQDNQLGDLLFPFGNYSHTMDTTFSGSTSNYSWSIHTGAVMSDGLISAGVCSRDGGPSGTAWYYNEGYNDGWPYLRSFISWYTYKFRNNGSNSDTHILYYPSTSKTITEELTDNGNTIVYEDLDGDDNNDTLVTNQTLVVYAGAVMADVPDGYNFAYWRLQYDGAGYRAIRFIAVFKLQPFDITFNTLAGATVTNAGTYSINKEIDITVIATIYQIIYSFRDVEGYYHTVTYTLAGEDGEYYFDPTTYANLSGETLYSNATERTICPELLIKSFGVEFT